MLCYKDMTFCKFYKECAELKCFRALTPDIVNAADKFGLPVSLFVSKPECFKEKKGE